MEGKSRALFCHVKAYSGFRKREEAGSRSVNDGTELGCALGSVTVKRVKVI